MTQAFIHVRAQHLDDRELVKRFKATGNPAWFGALYERHQGRLYALCCDLVANRALAEDLVQETFMRAFQEIDRFNERDPQSRFDAWLCTIGRHLCLSELRSSRRQRERALSMAAVVDPESQTEDALLFFHQLETELMALPEAARHCWLLFYGKGYTYEEIARLTGYSFHQIKNALHQARQELKRKLR